MKQDQATQLRQLMRARVQSQSDVSTTSATSRLERQSQVQSEDRTGLSDEAKQPSTGLKTIVVTGGKGGIGKTNLSANLAIAIAQSGFRVGILDADLGLANIDVLFRLTPKYNLRHVLTGEKRIEEIQADEPTPVEIAQENPTKIEGGVS